MRISIISPSVSSFYDNPSYIFLLVLIVVSLLALMVYVARSNWSSSNIVFALVMCLYGVAALVTSSALTAQSVFFLANRLQILQLLFFWVVLSALLVKYVGMFLSKVNASNIIIIQQAIIIISCVVPLVSFKFVSLMLVLESVNFFIICYLIYISSDWVEGTVLFIWVSLAFNLSLVFSWVIVLADTCITCGGYYLATSSEISSLFLFLAVGIKVGLYPLGSWIMGFYNSLDLLTLVGYFVSAYIPTLMLCMALILSSRASLHLPGTTSLYVYVVTAFVFTVHDFNTFVSLQSEADGMSIILAFLTFFLATSTMLLLVGCLCL